MARDGESRQYWRTRGARRWRRASALVLSLLTLAVLAAARAVLS